MKHFLKNDSVGHYLLKIEDKVNFKHISHLVLLFIVNFEHVIRSVVVLALFSVLLWAATC